MIRDPLSSASPEVDAGDVERAADDPLVGFHPLLFQPPEGTLPERFPFSSVLSFHLLIERWRQEAARGDPATVAAWRTLEGALERAPELTEPIRDDSVLDRHTDTVELLLSRVYPRRGWSSEMKAIISPFAQDLTWPTDRLREVLGDRKTWGVQLWTRSALFSQIFYAYRAVFSRVYGVTVRAERPAIFTAEQPDTGLERSYKLTATSEFVDLRATAPVPELSDGELRSLIGRYPDLRTWIERIPPDGFQFVGLSIVTFMDVTTESSTAYLRHMLLTDEMEVSDRNFPELEHQVRVLLRNPRLRLGLASIQGDGRLNFRSGRRVWNSLAVRGVPGAESLDLAGSPYETVMRERRLVVHEDLRELPDPSPASRALIQSGVRSLTLAPLTYADRLVGLVELSSDTPGDLDAVSALKLLDVTPILALAIQRNLETFERRVDAVIQEQFTAIHPTVAWRFRDAAIHVLERRAAGGGKGDADPIVFENVYALFGAADVRSSSVLRNEAVRKDRVAQVERVRGVLRALVAVVPLALLDALDAEAARHLSRLSERFDPSEDIELGRFLEARVGPVLDHLAQDHPAASEVIEAFRAERDAGAPDRFDRRSEFEGALGLVNDAIAEVLDAEVAELQKVHPLYYERFKTDGVEHNLYIGPSLSPDRAFHDTYLGNLRLRQLVVCCEIASTVRRLAPGAGGPLEVAQVVLTRQRPLTISFRQDERRFDVLGGDSIQWEVTKKRIDKAVIAGTGERLTRPDHVAIVLSEPRELDEYRGYLAYLSETGRIRGPVEELELEELSGVGRLRALRVRTAEGGPDRAT